MKISTPHGTLKGDNIETILKEHGYDCLHDANLRYADLRGANLHGANLCGADLSDADRAARMAAPATIRVGRFSPGSGGENGKERPQRS